MVAYKDFVHWIAHNDNNEADDIPPDLAGYVTVCMVAHTYDKDPETVAHDVYRARHPKYKRPRKDVQREVTTEEYRNRAKGRNDIKTGALRLNMSAHHLVQRIPDPNDGETLVDYRERAGAASPFVPNSASHERWMTAVGAKCTKHYKTTTSLHKASGRAAIPSPRTSK